jgi:hypothetical protein
MYNIGIRDYLICLGDVVSQCQAMKKIHDIENSQHNKKVCYMLRLRIIATTFKRPS